jgi:glycosyltransferase involved in cell wall biosynthesis
MTVYIDLSPLDTPSRLRGIGQYILGLVSGIRELQAAGELDLEIDGMGQFDWRGRVTRSDGLNYQGTPVHPDHHNERRYLMRKRLGLGRAAVAKGAQLLHVTEPLGLPMFSTVPMVLTAYDLIPLVLHREYLGVLPWKRLLRHWQDSRNYRAARRITAISQATRADLVEYLGIDEKLIDVAHLGVDHARFNPIPSAADERERICEHYKLTRPFLLYLGAYDSRKNVALLVRAFANAGLARDFDLVLAGAIRERYKARLATLASELGVASSLRFLGFVEDGDLAPLYRACHWHVFPSKYEGFGLPVAEALACGAPTITTNASSLPEVAGDAAVLVPPEDVDAFTEALRSHCYDDKTRDDFVQAGPKMATRFSWRECARATVATYKKALG